MQPGAIDPSSIAQNPDGSYPKIIRHSGLPSNAIIGSINGLLGGTVLPYAGLQLFVEFLAEMRRPKDFLKVSMRCSYHESLVIANIWVYPICSR